MAKALSVLSRLVLNPARELQVHLEDESERNWLYLVVKINQRLTLVLRRRTIAVRVTRGMQCSNWGIPL